MISSLFVERMLPDMKRSYLWCARDRTYRTYSCLWRHLCRIAFRAWAIARKLLPALPFFLSYNALFFCLQSPCSFRFLLFHNMFSPSVVLSLHRETKKKLEAKKKKEWEETGIKIRGEGKCRRKRRTAWPRKETKELPAAVHWRWSACKPSRTIFFWWRFTPKCLLTASKELFFALLQSKKYSLDWLGVMSKAYTIIYKYLKSRRSIQISNCVKVLKILWTLISLAWYCLAHALHK